MTRAITLTSAGGTVTLGRPGPFRLLRAMVGTGLPPVQNQWFEGAGDGADYRGTRVLARSQSIPIKVTGADRIEVWANYEKLAQIFAAGEATMKINLDGEEWYNTFVREGGGDFNWDIDTDQRSFIKTVITVKAGSPYFTRTQQTSQQITLGGLGRGLIKSTSLSKLKVSTNNSLGSVQLFNPGSVGVGGLWVLEGPFTSFNFVSPTGEVLEWDSTTEPAAYGAPTSADTLTVDFELGTIVDNLDRNRFGGFVGIPNFWDIPAGTTTSTIEVEDATSDTSVTILFNPKRWVMF